MCPRRSVLFARRKVYLIVTIVGIFLLVLYPINNDESSPNEPSGRDKESKVSVDKGMQSSNRIDHIYEEKPTYIKTHRKTLKPENHFTGRLEVYNDELMGISEAIRYSLMNMSWRSIAMKLEVVNGHQEYFLEKLEHHRFVHSLVLAWDESARSINQPLWNSLRDQANILVTRYYEWTCDKLLYKWIATPNMTKPRYDLQYEQWCQTNMSQAIRPQSMEPVYFNMNEMTSRMKHREKKTTEKWQGFNILPDHVFYIHIFTHAVVTRFGYVISRHLKVVPLQCMSEDFKPHPPTGYKQFPLYDEVFVIAQFWGEGYYHRNMEMLPRLGPYLYFLQQYPHVKIHTAGDGAKMKEFMVVLGLDPDRLTSGDIRAGIVHLPQSTGCGGTSQVQGTQILSKHFQDYAKEHFGKVRKRAIVLVKRSFRRRLLYHDEILARMKNISLDYNLEFIHFDDMDLPDLKETIRIFNKAFVIVGPHGAGLSNMLFSKPGTLIIEGMCDLPHINTCFQMGAHILGHRYHGIPSIARNGCMKHIHVPPQTFEEVVRFYLDELHVG